MSVFASGVYAEGVYAEEDEGGDAHATPANSASPATVSSSSATQLQRASAADCFSGATVTSTVASQNEGEAGVSPANSVSGATVTASSARQTHQASPAAASGGAVVSNSRAIVLSLELTYPIASYPDMLQSAEYPVQ